MNNKKNKGLRGMTLVEIIVAIAVLAVLALLLAMVGKSVEQYRMQTKRTNDMVALESPIAENQSDISGGHMIDDDMDITVKAPGMSDACTIKARLYDTNPDTTVKTGITDDGLDIYEAADGKSLKYIYIPAAH